MNILHEMVFYYQFIKIYSG